MLFMRFGLEGIGGEARKAHWEGIYEKKAPDEVSWYQADPEISLRLIDAITDGDVSRRLLDVGGGASLLTDRLLDLGYESLGILDVASSALRRVRERLGDRGEGVEWFESDVTSFTSPHPWDVWHDRAVFHFLTDPGDRREYVKSLEGALALNGHAIIATFGPDGPPKCSGLDVVRYSPEALADELGGGFQLLQSTKEQHSTPSGARQAFAYSVFRRKD
jgi:SAM-dependent methyltransferase